MDAVKGGGAPRRCRPSSTGRRRCRGAPCLWTAGSVDVTLDAPGADVGLDDGDVVLTWRVPRARITELGWDCAVVAPDAVVGGATNTRDLLRAGTESRTTDCDAGSCGRPRGRLDALRLTRPEGEFLAAVHRGSSRSSAATRSGRRASCCPSTRRSPGGTLRVLAALQGTRTDPATAEQPGKVMHELRQATLAIDNDELSLPPLYYGTVDATALWVCLLHDAWRAGLRTPRSRRCSLRSNGPWCGCETTVTTTVTGCSSTSTRPAAAWRTRGGRTPRQRAVARRDARGEGRSPSARCRATRTRQPSTARDLLDAFGRTGGDGWRAWAARLAERFREAFWVRDEVGPYPAIALDAAKRPVDSATSNIGHLLGTGILSPEEEAVVAARVVAPDMARGSACARCPPRPPAWPLSTTVAPCGRTTLRSSSMGSSGPATGPRPGCSPSSSSPRRSRSTSGCPSCTPGTRRTRCPVRRRTPPPAGRRRGARPAAFPVWVALRLTAGGRGQAVAG